MLDFNLDAMLFTIPADKHEKTDLMRILKEHPEVQFVSMAGLDMVGNDTDERIPIRLFLEDMDDMLKHGVQTDGSSVNLPKIAELNNAKVDMIPDLAVDKSIYYPKFLYRDTKARDAYRKEIKKSKSYRNDIFVLDILREEMSNDDPRIQRSLFE